MKIAYFSTDEVNRALAIKFARRQDHTVVASVALGSTAPSDLDAVIYDLDYLPTELRQDILYTLSLGPCPIPVAVHSYNLEDDCKTTLHRNGVLVYRRLRPQIFRKLAHILIGYIPRPARPVALSGATGDV
jgi:hypothetical protein